MKLFNHKSKFILLLLLLPWSSFAFTSVSDHPNLSGAVSYWKHDEVSGVRYDAKGVNNLSDVNSVGSATGVLNLGSDFESGSSQGEKITDASQTGLDGMTNLSAYCWVKPEHAPSSGEVMTIFSKYRTDDATNSQFPYKFVYHNSGGTKYLRMELYDGTNYTVESVAADLGTGVHLVGLSFDGSPDTIKFFLDGVQQGATQNTGTMNALQNDNASFAFGLAGVIVTNEDYFDGVIDECLFADFVMTAQDHSDAFNSGAGLCYDVNCGVTATTTAPYIIPVNLENMPLLESVVCDQATCTAVYATSSIQYATFQLYFMMYVVFFTMACGVGFIVKKFL